MHLHVHGEITTAIAIVASALRKIVPFSLRHVRTVDYCRRGGAITCVCVFYQVSRKLTGVAGKL